MSLNASISPSTTRFPHSLPRRLRLILSLPRRLRVCGLDRRRSESFSVKVDEAASLFLFLDDSAFLDSLRRRLRLVLVKPRPIGFSLSLPRRLRLPRLCPLTTPPHCGETSTTPLLSFSPLMTPRFSCDLPPMMKSPPLSRDLPPTMKTPHLSPHLPPMMKNPHRSSSSVDLIDGQNLWKDQQTRRLVEEDDDNCKKLHGSRQMTKQRSAYSWIKANEEGSSIHASSKKTAADGKELSQFQTMWSLKKEDLALKERLSKMKLLDRLHAKEGPLPDYEEALKKKLIDEFMYCERLKPHVSMFLFIHGHVVW
ncbi:hypothetical protein F2Q68_00011939 [Brassica cretica]|uniref:No apical meristem-associated C-terminal domain-containing protein n=1 Tax=Brassica cretica TaxID=69181 RepID=A0A8S9KL74_BRACR|nr:hypothetical protein F2Q68_00011939 [Brassica cretica]